MKVAFISTNEFAPWGGSEELWSQTAIRMANQGFTVIANIKGWNPEAKQIANFEQANCQVVRRWYSQNFTTRILRKLGLNKNSNFLDSFSPNFVVISQGFSSDGLLWMEECLSRNIPFAVIVQAASDTNSWLPHEQSLRLARAMLAAKKCFFVSQANLETLIKITGVNLLNAQIVANPFNVAYDIKIPWVSDEKTLKLACVARLDLEAKGHDILLQVLKNEKWKNRNIEISLFGKGNHCQLLERLIDIWEINQIKLFGHVNDISTIWKEHHALLLPSRHEGLPLSLVEAMLCARTAIVTDVGGNAELVEDNITGFVAQAPNAEFLDEALERAWQNRKNLCEIGKMASTKVRQIIPNDPIELFTNIIKSLL
jgi:glycosyltransferase involved in cell wall biosynthesis